MLAHLEDSDSLARAIRDLHAYAVQRTSDKTKYAIVYRVVTEQDRDAVNHKLQNLFGVTRFAAASADYCPPVGHYHMIDSEHIAHVCNRHSDRDVEHKRGHLPVAASDFEMVPVAVSPKNIQEFQMSGDLPRIIYSMDTELARLIVVEEFSRKRGLIFKTAYKQKK